LADYSTFLANHVEQVVAADFFVVPTATYQLLFVLVLLAHKRRRIVRITSSCSTPPVCARS
jgi:putative transposase